MNIVKTGTNQHYKGVLHRDSLHWCHGSVGVRHEKIRKFRYPFYKYSNTEDAQVYRIVICICKNCNMLFWGDSIKSVPLDIPVKKLDSFVPYQIQVTVNNKRLAINGEIVTPFRHATQEEINEETRIFIDHAR